MAKRKTLVRSQKERIKKLELECADLRKEAKATDILIVENVQMSQSLSYCERQLADYRDGVEDLDQKIIQKQGVIDHYVSLLRDGILKAY